MSRFLKLFRSVKCAVIGMVHVKALPGTPRSTLSIQQIVTHACAEADTYKKYGVDGIIVENMFDIPYVSGDKIGPEITSTMTRICSEVKNTVGDLPCGVQVLSGNNYCAVAVAFASGFQFIRAESFVFAHIADEGLMQACAGPLLRYARNIGAQDILIFTDIKKKHCSHALTADLTLPQMAKAAEFFLSDGVIITGVETGDAPSTKELENVREVTKLPTFIGSGVMIENIENFFTANAVIVGSHFKHNGNWTGALDSNRISKFMDKMQELRSDVL